MKTTCGHCGAFVEATLINGDESPGSPAALQCPGCGEMVVKTSYGDFFPVPMPGQPIGHLPADVEGAWREALRSYGAGAYTASEIMCRKILMHVAVGVANSDPGETFASYVNDLQAEGYITKGLETVVDGIRSRGNTANHDLPASTQDEATETLRVTEYLLRGTYELSGGTVPPADPSGPAAATS